MLTLKSSAHIRRSRNIKGFRSCRHATGVSLAHLDRGRISLEEERLPLREARRRWLAKNWSEHPARSRQMKVR